MEIPMLIVLGADGKQESENGIRNFQNHNSGAFIEAWEKLADAVEADAGQEAAQQ